MPKFTGYIRATARVSCDAFEVEADTLEEAIAKAKAEGITPYTFEMECDSDIEGDEIAYIVEMDGQEIDDGPIEVTLAEPGEPFSWAACDLVKHLAAQPDIPDIDLLLQDRGRIKDEIEGFRDFITKARALCQQDDS
jgi:hypothetical protein